MIFAIVGVMEALTLSFLIKNDRICLALKKRGFGEGNWNGYGGKLMEKESILDAAVREIHEESTVAVEKKDLTQIARIEFIFENGMHLDVHTFFARKWKGEPQETEEMRPEWFLFTEIPYEYMWEDDRYWLPRAILGETLLGKVWFDHSERHIKEMEWVRASF